MITDEDDPRLIEVEKMVRRYKANATKIALGGAVLFVSGFLFMRPLMKVDQPMLAAFMVFAGFFSMIGGAVVAVFTGNPRPMVQRQHTEGAKLVKLANPVKSEGVPIGNARMPHQAEPLHMLIEGAPGTGKTQMLKRLVDYVRHRGDTVIVVDSNYDMHKALSRPGDIVLSAFDESGPGWLPQNEIRSPADWSALAQSFIGDGRGDAAQWHQMAKAMFSAVARGYQREVEKAGEAFDHRELFHLLTQAPAADLAPFIAGTAAAGLAENEKGLANVRMTFFDTLKSWEYLRSGSFSVRDWVENGVDGPARPSIFIPYRTRQLGDAKNLISCWLDQIITTAIDAGENRDNRVWVVIDELSGLGEIPGLKQAVAQLRKTGFCIVTGIQAMEQIEDVYGRNGAISITANLGNKVILRTTDAASAERQSKLIGDARFRIINASQTQGEKISTNQSAKDEVSRIVLASEIMALPDLNALVHWAGADTWFYTPVPIYQPGEWDTQKRVEAAEAPALLPAPTYPPTPEQEALQARLRASGPITPEGMDRGEGPRPAWAQVDDLLRKIGGPGWDGEKFRAKVLASLGWHPETGWDEGRAKVSRAYERARQLLAQTLDRSQIERNTSSTPKNPEEKDK